VGVAFSDLSHNHSIFRLQEGKEKVEGGKTVLCDIKRACGTSTSGVTEVLEAPAKGGRRPPRGKEGGGRGCSCMEEKVLLEVPQSGPQLQVGIVGLCTPPGGGYEWCGGHKLS